jgi:hypothetical protein
MEENIFEKATRLNVRFEYKGQIMLEDLWDLSLEALDGIYTKLEASAKRSNEGGLLKTRKAEDKLTDLKLEIVKRVFEVKQEEDEKRKLVAKKRQQKDFLKGALEQKQNQAVLDMPIEKIQEMLEGLEVE